MTAIVTRGNAADLHLPDESVDLVVTSPPYFGLRSYQDGGEHYEGQVGDEATPTEYLDALIACTAEWMRVLKPGGSIFVNLGDKYSSAAGPKLGGRPAGLVDGHNVDRWVDVPRGRAAAGVPPKSLMLLPQRYAIRCVDDLGLILRAEIVWAKPNGLPESVTDRVRRSHEQVFHFVKQPRYYSAVDEVREALQDTSQHAARRRERGDARLDLVGGGQTSTANPLGKLPGSVWTIPTSPLRVPESLGIDHFAAYPPELVRRIVLGWSPREVCTRCGEGRRPVRGRACEACGEFIPTQGKRCDACGHVRDWKAGRVASEAMGATDWSTAGHGTPRHPGNYQNTSVVNGYECGWICKDADAETVPGVVLDPFGGTGTSALVASCYGRVGISVDLSADYCRLAQWRTTDPGERARVLGVDKPPVQVDGQQDLFGELTA